MVVHRFLEWMQTAPPQLRAEAVAPLVRTFLQADIQPAEFEALEAALTLLLDDPCVEVRRALAEAIARQETAPRHLVVGLSHDLPDVSEPIFLHSPCLLVPELVEAVGRAGPKVQIAIARRPWVPYAVSEEIAAEGCVAAVLALARNDGSDMDEIAYQKVVARFGANGEVREALFARDNLPISVRQSMIAGLGAKLGELMVSREWMPPGRAEAVVREACDKATVAIAASAADQDLPSLVEHLRTTGQLTTALLIRSICHGRLGFLEVALARLANLPPQKVYAILSEGREGALRALFTRAALPERTHAAFVVAVEAWRDLSVDGSEGDQARFTRRMIERILTRYQQFSVSEVDDLLALLRKLAADAARESARAYARSARQTLEAPVLRMERIAAAA